MFSTAVEITENLTKVVGFTIKAVCYFAKRNPGMTLLLVLSSMDPRSFATASVPLRFNGELLSPSFSSVDSRSAIIDLCPPHQPSTEHESIPAFDLSEFKSHCKDKSAGASHGKMCTVKDAWSPRSTTYFLKSFRDPKQNQGNNAFVGEYNRRLLGENIGIRVPHASFFCEKSKTNDLTCYAGSEMMHDLEHAREWCVEEKTYGYYRQDAKIDCHYDRNKIIDAIGESGLAKIAVANTFIQDLHSANWGGVHGELVIIDMDKSPHTIDEYVSWTVERFTSGSRFDLSLEDITRMKSIYETMLTMKYAPSFHSSVDVGQEMYETLVGIYLSACIRTIDQIDIQFPNLDPATPLKKINEIFSSEVQKTKDVSEILPHHFTRDDVGYSAVFKQYRRLCNKNPTPVRTCWIQGVRTQFQKINYHEDTMQPNQNHALVQLIGIRSVGKNVACDDSAGHNNNCYIDLQLFTPLTSYEGIEKQVGEDEITQLAVASTFLRDISPSNSVLMNKAIAFININVDPSLQKMEDYFSLARSNFLSAYFKLSLNNVIGMKSIYEKLLNSPTPTFHSQTHLNEESYKTILKFYIQCCERTINQFHNLAPDEKTHKISIKLAREIRQQDLSQLTEVSRLQKTMRA